MRSHYSAFHSCIFSHGLWKNNSSCLPLFLFMANWDSVCNFISIFWKCYFNSDWKIEKWGWSDASELYLWNSDWTTELYWNSWYFPLSFSSYVIISWSKKLKVITEQIKLKQVMGWRQRRCYELYFICRSQTAVKHLCASTPQSRGCLFMHDVAFALLERRNVKGKTKSGQQDCQKLQAWEETEKLRCSNWNFECDINGFEGYK